MTRNPVSFVFCATVLAYMYIVCQTLLNVPNKLHI